ncbi:MAG: Gfo/Idh/MocA family oxidoreductase [Rhodospirillales bacterium]|nr:Gfo/Idh/MocA family oxidoreductase [Rhodospirillales bacterium]
MPKPCRIAVIGAGMALAPHARSLRELQDAGMLEVAAIWSPSEARRSAAATQWGFPARDSFAAIADDAAIDAALLLTPANARLEFVEALAGAGKHILSEKPLERTTGAAEHIVARCAAAGVKLGVVFQYRFRPSSIRLREVLAAGELGAPSVVQVAIPWWREQRYYDEPGRGTRARDGGGVLISQAIHTLDLMLSLLGPVAELAAIAGTSALHRMECEDTLGAGLRFANGALGGVFASTACYPGAAETLSITGTKGAATIAAGALRLSWFDGRREEVAGDAATGGGADPMAFANDAHRALIGDFVDAIRNGRDPAVSGREALGVHRLIDALLASAGQGRALAPA